MDIHINDELVMKKPHPCGNNRFLVLRVGMDFKIRCIGCGREVMTPRKKVEHNIRQVFRVCTSPMWYPTPNPTAR